MTPAQVAHIMALVDKFAETCVRPVTLENVKVAEKARAAVEAALRDAPQHAAPIAEARKADDVDRLLHQVFLLCEAVEDAPAIAPQNEHERGFDRGRRFEAKQIRRAIGDWFQWTFCGRSFMGEPVLAAAPTEAKPAQQDAVDAEPKSLNAKIADQLRPFLKPGDKVIWREAFRWHDDNGVMPNHYDGMSIAGLADEFGYQFDWDFNMNHAAIVRAAISAKKGQP